MCFKLLINLNVLFRYESMKSNCKRSSYRSCSCWSLDSIDDCGYGVVPSANIVLVFAPPVSVQLRLPHVLRIAFRWSNARTRDLTRNRISIFDWFCFIKDMLELGLQNDFGTRITLNRASLIGCTETFDSGVQSTFGPNFSYISYKFTSNGYWCIIR